MATNCVVSLELLPGLTIAVPTTSTVDDWERSSEYLNPANYDGATYYFECTIQGISGLAVTLRDITNSADLASVTTNTTSQKRYRSTAFTPAAGNNLLQIRTPSNASANGFIYSARIVIVQANATKTRISVPLSLQYYGSDTHLSYFDVRATNTYAQPSALLYPIWPYTAANFSTISAASFECMLYSSGAGYTVYAALTKTDGTVAAECSTNSAAQQYLTAAATLVDGTSYEVRIKGDGTRSARLAKSALYLTLDPLTKGETYFLLGWGRQRTVDLSSGSSIVKLETGLYSSPIVYADYTAWLAATDDYAAGQLKLHTLGTNDTVTGASAIASSAWNMNTTTAKAYYRAGPVTFTADNRAVQAVDYNAQAVNDCTVMAVVAFTGTSGTTLTAASTLTGLLSASATLGNTAPAATTMTAASTLTGLTAGAAALSWTAATPTTLTAASTLTGFTAGAGAVAHSPATPKTMTAASTLTGFAAGAAALAWNLTFGYTSIIAGHSLFGANTADAFKATLSEAGTVSKLSIYLQNTWDQYGHYACSAKSFIFTDNGGTIVGGSLVTGSVVELAFVDDAPAAWYDFVFPTPILLAAGVYWLGFIGSSSTASGLICRYTSSGSGKLAEWSEEYSHSLDTPNTAGATYSNYDMSVYAAYTPSASTTLTAASTLTGLTAGAAAMGNTAPTATTLTAASTLTGFTAGSASLAWSPATPTTLTAASTLTAFTAGTAAVSWTAAPASTLTADSTLTGMTAGSASITWTGPPATTLTGSSTLTGYVSASADLANTPPAAVTMTAASTLTATVSASADLIAALPTLMTAASTLTGKVSGVSYIMVGVSGPIRWTPPRHWPNSSTERGRQRQPVPAAPAKWRWDHER